MRPHRKTDNGSFLGRGELPTKPSVKCILLLLGVITAGCYITAEGQFLTPAAETGAENLLRGGGSSNDGGLRFPESESEERGSPRSWTRVDGTTTVGPNRDIELDDGHGETASLPRILEEAPTVASGSEGGGDVQIVIDPIVPDNKPDEDGGEEEDAKKVPEKKRLPRILTVLTTYNKRSSFVKAYREAVGGRSDGYRPTVSFLVIAVMHRAVGRVFGEIGL